MQFNKLQSKLWANMLELIKKFRKEEINYSELIYRLEGALDAGDYQNEELVKQWYDYWTPLEIEYVNKGNNVSIGDINGYLSDMELFLESVSMGN